MSFDKLLNPASVAVVGASAKPDKVGYAVVNNIIAGGFTGAVYPVNPKVDEILGKKCYKSLAEIPGDVECAVIVVKRDQVTAVLKDCIEKNTKAVIIITAGFAETGEEGKKLQHEIAQMARQAGITLLGPNCLGIINPVQRFNASFGQPLGEPGNIAFVSQSGALITAIQDIASSNRVGFSLLVSMGNKAALDEVQLLENLRNEENTKVVAAYLEDIPRGQDFMRVAERVGKTEAACYSQSGPHRRRARRRRRRTREALRAPTRRTTARSSARALSGSNP